MSVADTQSAQEELEAYHQAYLYLFRTILSKRGLPPEKQRQLLSQIQNFQQTKIQSVDSYLNHIPTFARALGVKPDQLGAYIGANFLKALHQVQAQMAQKRKAAEEASRLAEDPAVKRSILKEIAVTIGSIVEAPNRFVPQERGLLALSIGEELILSKTAESEAAASPAIAVTGKPAKSQGASSVKEPSILEEIVETLGDALTNTEKLAVPAFPKAMREEMEKAQISVSAPATDAADPAKEPSILEEIVKTLGSALTNTEKLAVPAFPKAMREEMEKAQISVSAPAADAADPAKEPSILEEIVKTLGSALTNTEKLVVPAFPKAMREEMEAASGILPDAPAPPMASTPVFVPLDFRFGDYMKALKQVQAFQAKKDGAGYQRWLKEEATTAVRLMLLLRKAETRASRGEAVDWPAVYGEAAQNLDVGLEQAEELHKRIRKYARMQRLQSQFIAQVKKQPPVLLQAIQKLWPQIQLILDDEDTIEGRMKQLQFPMLQITNPKVKEAVVRLVKPLFVKMDEIARA